jgi:hypothetical protein
MRSINKRTGDVTFRRKSGEFVIVNDKGKIVSYGAAPEAVTGTRIRQQ